MRIFFRIIGVVMDILFVVYVIFIGLFFIAAFLGV